MTTASLLRIMNVSANTKRASVVSGKRGLPALYLTNISCMPLDPIGVSETRERVQRMGLNSPISLFQTVTEGDQDIRTGDILSVGSVDYAIRDIEDWTNTVFADDALMRLILEKVDA